MIGPTSSRAPTSAASMRVLPSRTCRSTFSTTTIASSTTRPTDSTIARIVSRFRLKPKASITIAAPTSETGIATSGTSAVRTEPMNRNTTRPTIRIVSVSVLVISVERVVHEHRAVVRQPHVDVLAAASAGGAPSRRAGGARPRSRWRRPAARRRGRRSPRRLYLATRSASSAPSSTRATSRRRTIAPSRSATIRSSNSSTERRSVFASRLTCTRLPLVWPTAAR